MGCAASSTASVAAAPQPLPPAPAPAPPFTTFCGELLALTEGGGAAHGLPRLLALYAAVSATAAASAASPPALDAEVWAAIDRDVGRTLGAGEGPPPGVDGEARLRRVLVALALVDRGVAYVQGLNFMAAFALRHGGWEEAPAFALLARLLFAPRFRVAALHRGDLRGARVFSAVVDALLPAAAPRVAAHLAALGLTAVIIFEWVFCLFTLPLPDALVCAVWREVAARGFAPAAHLLVLALLRHLGPHMEGKDLQGTLFALKGFARARTLRREGGGGGGGGSGGGGGGEGEDGLPPPLDPPADLLQQAAELGAALGITAERVEALTREAERVVA